MPSQRGRSLLLKRILALLSLACIAGFAGCGKGPGSSPSSSEDPGGPLHFSCSEHPRVVSREEGDCSVCGLELTRQKSVGTFLCVDHFESASVVPAGCAICDKLLVAVPGGKIWKCTSHPEVVLDDPGACPVCDLELVEVLVGLVWVCPKSLEETLGEEGATGLTVLRLQGRSLGFSTEEVAFGKQDCSRCGRPLLEVTVQVPHGDHNPRHGGIFRMASDNRHHMEAVVSQPGVLRLFFFDSYTRPMAAGGFKARYLRATLDEKEGLVDGAESFDLEPAESGAYLEAQIEDYVLPLHLVVKAEIDGRKERFDFTFRSPGSAEVAPADKRTRRPEDDLEIPSSAAGIVAAMKSRNARVQELIRGQEYKSLFIPAFEAKVLALELEKKFGPGEEAGRRLRLERGVKEVVRGAWLLDHFGDQGDRTEVLQQHRVFSEGVKDLEALFPSG